MQRFAAKFFFSAGILRSLLLWLESLACYQNSVKNQSYQVCIKDVYFDCSVMILTCYLTRRFTCYKPVRHVPVLWVDEQL
jgi:hypothetical protein